ncbi:hypothetical protein COR50_15260 [Chitinophaga caeni]|uniref:PKD/Chitinase domain-containing protein n=1 Tax=Chitinophaga caeni TaxID=2029983 RepID=A0A291QWV0_9BACT|nr:gliding motility-associated C-terminal domain-containing protein [Chitinophaga caeni]ATL48410.1 hypothetical protein COR50_15260 [Chitinophaga caeni]
MRKFLRFLSLILVSFAMKGYAQTPSFSAPTTICKDSYASMHGFFTGNQSPSSYRWTITAPSGSTTVNYRYGDQNSESITVDLTEVGTYKVELRLRYSGNNYYKTKYITVEDCTIESCLGSFVSDKNFKETFGTFASGEGRRSLDPTIISYNYNQYGDLADNDYSIYYNTRTGGRPEWVNSGDHTGDTRGGMLIANSSYDPRMFYTRRVDGLCPGAVYNFTAWFMNLNPLEVFEGTCEKDYKYAGVTFIIRNAANGAEIKRFNTYDVSMDLSGPDWQQYGGSIRLQPGQESLILEVVNNNPGGCGNDIAIDDIAFEYCAPKIYSYIDGLSYDKDAICQGAPITLTSEIEPINYFLDPVYYWETSTNGTTWTPVSGAGYTGTNTPTLDISAGVLNSVGTYYFRLMVNEDGNSNACYTPSNMVTLTILAKPQITVTEPVICEGNSTILTVNPTNYDSYSFTGPDITYIPGVDYQVSVKPPVSSSYSVTAVANYGNGKSCSETVSANIQVDKKPVVDLGPDLDVCSGTPITLDAGDQSGYGINWTWSGTSSGSVSGGETFTRTFAPGSYNVNVLVTNGTCSTADQVAVNVSPAPTANALPTGTLCVNYALLRAVAVAAPNVGTWSIVGNDYGAVLSPASLPNQQNISNLPPDQPVVVRWSVTNPNYPDCSAFKDITVLYNAPPGPAEAGTAQIQCGSRTFTMNADPIDVNDIGTWTTGTSGVTIASINDPNTTVTLAPGVNAATLTWTVRNNNNSCGSVSDNVSLSIQTAPTLVVGSVSAVCIGSGGTTALIPFVATGSPTLYDLQATGANPMPGFTDLADQPMVASPLSMAIPAGTPAGTYTFTMTVKNANPGCSGSANFTVTVSERSSTPIIAAPPASICEGNSVTLNVSGTLGTSAQWVWYEGGCGVGTAIGSGSSITVTPSATTTYYVRSESTGACANDICTSVTVNVDEMPATVSAGADQENCDDATFTMNATPASAGTGTWTIVSGTATIADINDPATEVTVAAGNTVVLSWQVTNGTCASNISNVTLINRESLTGNSIGSNQNICEGDAVAEITGTVPSGGDGTYTYTWEMSTTGASGPFTPIASANGQNYDPGTITQNTWFRRTVTSGECTSTSNVVAITIYTGSPETATVLWPQDAECDPGTDYTTLFGNPVFTHPDGVPFTVDHQDVTVPFGCGIQITRTWTATDDCGKTGTISQTITVRDTRKPTFSNVPADVTISCEETIPAIETPTVTDECTTGIIPVFTSYIIDGTEGCANDYTLVRVWTATDACNNTDSVRQVITITDNKLPVFVNPPAAYIEVECDAVPAVPTLTATDNCGTPDVQYMGQSTTGDACNTTITRTWKATDACGNAELFVQTIVVKDETAPEFTFVPADVTVPCGTVVPVGNPTAVDACGTAHISFDGDTRVDGSCPNSYEIHRKWIVVDDCNNEREAIQVITFVDDVAPVFDNAPADATYNCDDVIPNNTVTASDNCGTAVVSLISNNTIPGACPGSYQIVRTWEAEDQCGNTATHTQTITVEDNVAPVIQAKPADITVECSAIPAVPTLTATDNCDADVPVQLVSETTSGSGCSYTITRVWRATDDCGNFDEHTQVITVEDHTAPVFVTTPTAMLTVECDNIPARVLLDATDNCDTDVEVTLADDLITPGSCPGNYNITRTWTATDDCGNSITFSQIITVNDNTPPVFVTVPDDVTVECDEVVPVELPTVQDACTGATVSHVGDFDDPANPATCVGSRNVIRRFRAVDECGNEAIYDQKITIEDHTAPTIPNFPADITVECDNIPAVPTLTATDICDPAPTISPVNEVSEPVSCSYKITRTWTVTDACGNTQDFTQTITVEDHTAPVITNVPAGVTVNCDEIPARVDPLFTDNCDAAPVMVYDTAITATNDGCANSYTITRTWTVTDACGNSGSRSQVINIIDTKAPVFTVTPPATLDVQCDAVPSASSAVLEATDNCGTAPVTIRYVGEVISNQDPACPGKYTITRTWEAEDECGNVQQFVQVIHVSDDTAPAFDNAPADITVDCDNIPAAPVVTATDNCGAATVAPVDEQRVDGSCDYTYTLVRTWTARDACGNEATHVQRIEVQDNTAPVFSNEPANVTVDCDNIPAVPAVTITDNCDPAPVLDFDETETAGTCPVVRIITRTWTATDACGNTNTHTQVITVEDHTAPTIPNFPADITVECDNIPAVPTLTSTDICDPAPTISPVNEVSEPVSCSYKITRTWTVTDACGNTQDFTQTITVEDHTAPVITNVPAGVTVNCDEIPARVDPLFTDNCDAAPVMVYDTAITATNDGCANSYTITRTWTVTDACGNSGSRSQVINIIDTKAPVFTVTPPATLDVQCDAVPSASSAVLEATDNCGTAPVTIRYVGEVISNQDPTCPGKYTITRTWEAEDECGNVQQFVQVIHVSDDTAPAFDNAPADITVDCDNIPVAPVVTATDNCGAATVAPVDEQRIDGSCDYTYTLVRTWTARDACGNEATHVQRIEVQDNTAPVFSNEPANVTVDCDNIPAVPVVMITDNCDPAPVLDFDETETAGTCPVVRIITRTWTATDACGNTNTHTQVITVEDHTAPTIPNFPADITVECDNIPAVPTLTATDICDPAPTISPVNEVSEPVSCSYKITRTWTVTDACGNTQDFTQTITVEDHTAPVITNVPAGVTVNCDEIPARVDPLFTDNCDAAPVMVYDTAITATNDGCANSYTITRTWTVTDACGNSGSRSQVINIIDTKAPVFTVTPPATLDVQCDAVPSASSVVLEATDNCGTAPVTIRYVGEVISNQDPTCPGKYTITRTWEAEDECGNVQQFVQVIHVSDDTAPAFDNAPADITVDCDNIPVAPVVTATDNCGAATVAPVDEQRIDGSCDYTYTLVRTWTARDACGNEATHVQRIEVQDNTAPEFSNEPANVTVDCDNIPAVPAVTITDNCDPAPVLDFDETETAGTCPVVRIITRTWTATDACGNTNTHTQVITVEDHTAPTIPNFPADITVECDNIPAVPTLTATDICDPAPTISPVNEVRETESCAYRIFRTWTVTDACGNTQDFTQTITVRDQTAPVFTNVPADVTVECDQIPARIDPVITDNCDANPVVTYDTSFVTSGCQIIITRRWQATDKCGNNDAVEQVITVVDNTAPSFPTPFPELTVECDEIPARVNPVATDNCGAIPSVNFLGEEITNKTCEHNYTITRRWEAVDECDNGATIEQVIHVVDNSIPTFDNAPADITIECGPLPAVPVVTASDRCDPPTVTYLGETEISRTCDYNYVVERKWSAVDDCGNEIIHTQRITVEDHTAPVLSGLPIDQTVSCDNIPAVPVVTANDACAGVLDVDFSEHRENQTCANGYTLVRTWRAEDPCGNVVEETRRITVVDNIAPVFSNVPANVTVSCDNIPAVQTPTVTDNCSVNIVPVFNENRIDGSCPNTYTIVRTWTATDECGNSATATQTIEVEDTEAPVFDPATPVDLYGTCDNIPAPVTPVATDNCSAAVSIDLFEYIQNPRTCPGTYVIVREWTATDECNLQTVFTQYVHISDTEAPEFIFVPTNITLNCGDAMPPFVDAVATDKCSIVSLSYEDQRVDSCGGSYKIIRTWTAKDACDNESTATQTIRFIDNKPPVITGVPADAIVNCDAIPAKPTVYIVDECSGYTDSYDERREGDDCGYKLIRTWTATDDCGNVATKSYTLFVQDTSRPVIVGVTADVNTSCDNIPVPPTPTVTDNCDTDVEIQFTQVRVNGSCSGTYDLIRTWIATDDCNNKDTAIQRVHVTDVVAPVFDNAPADVNVTCESIPDGSGVTATDNCSLATTVTFTDVKKDELCLGTYTIERTYQAVDSCGNVATHVQEIFVRDDVAPQFVNFPADVEVSCDAIPVAPVLTAVDNCGTASAPTMTERTENQTCTGSYDLIRTWTTQDDCGNSTSRSQTIRVRDTKAPVISGLAVNKTVNCDQIPAVPVLVATDNCSPYTLTYDSTIVGSSCSYEIRRVWTATDECGNTSTRTQIIKVRDVVAPVFTSAPANKTIACTDPVVPDVPTAVDNCSDVRIQETRVEVKGNCPGNYRVVYTWVAVDECGNESDPIQQTITIRDTEAPIFTSTPVNEKTVDCDAANTIDLPVATDNCSEVKLERKTTKSDDEACNGHYTLTHEWTATDSCGNKSYFTQIVHVVDNTAPVISGVPADTRVRCNEIPSFATVVISDNCGTATLKDHREDKIAGSCPNEYVLIRTWIAEDECGNIDSAKQRIEVYDDLPPVFSGVPADMDLSCGAIAPLINPTAADQCGTVAISFKQDTLKGACPGNYQVIRTWTATDACDNVDSVKQVLTYTDTEGPAFYNAPADSTISCDRLGDPAQPTIIDACSGVMGIVFDTRIENGSCANNYTVVRTWTATDSCGNVSQHVQRLTVADVTPPLFSNVPVDRDASCDNIPAPTDPTVADNCSPLAGIELSMRVDTIKGSCANNYTLVRTWIAEDECGNIDSVKQRIRVTDLTNPVLHDVPADITLNCGDVIPVANVTATDNCGTAEVSMTEARTPGACAGQYTVTRTWTATDACGNTSKDDQVITFVDNVAPVFDQVLSNKTIDCSETPAPEHVTATDNCGTVTITIDSTYRAGTCPTNYTRVYIYTATDDCGNDVTMVQEVNVVDTQAPQFTVVPARVAISCEEWPYSSTAEAVDNCGNVTMTSKDTIISRTCTNSFVVRRTWTAIDECGNTSTATQEIEVTDNTAPVLQGVPADIDVNCDQVPVPASVTATDACGTATVTYNEVVSYESCPVLRVYTRTWTATDECGNSTTASQIIRVIDNQAPTFSNIPADQTVSCDNIPPMVAPIAVDLCTNVTMTSRVDTTSKSCKHTYELTRTWIATDSCGNMDSVKQVIRVQDTEAPRFLSATPANITVDCENIPAPANMVAIDNCSATPDIIVEVKDVIETIPGACAGNYVIKRTWTATDECGNAFSVTQEITVQDNSAPTFTLGAPANITVECDAVPAMPTTLPVSDNCNPTGLNIKVEAKEERVDIPGACNNTYQLIRTWIASDSCGNVDSVKQIITVEDRTAPAFVINVPANITLSCDTILDQPDYEVVDNCSPLTDITVTKSQTRVDIPGACASNYELHRTWTLTDACGNSAVINQVVTVVDTTRPVFDIPVPADVTVQCDNIPAQVDITATDNCSPATAINIQKDQRREDIPGACSGNYRLVYTWTATDACGNDTTITQVVTVQDTTKPVFTMPLPKDTTVDCHAIIPQVNVSVTDNCTPSDSITITKKARQEKDPGACGQNYRIIYTWIAADLCGNIDSVQQVVTVVDTTGPVFTIDIPSDTTVDCDKVPPMEALNVIDNCSQPNKIHVDRHEERVEIPGACKNNYKLIRTWIATDECGMTSVKVQTITVQDTTRPQFIGTLPVDMTINCDETLPPQEDLTAADNCSLAAWVEKSESRQDGSCPQSSIITRRWIAYDSCGNSREYVQVITIQDTTRPVLQTPPADITVSCDAIPAQVDLTATDNCTPTAGIIIDKHVREIPNTTGNCADGYQLVYTWVATDQCNNIDSVSQVITVIDDVKPRFTMEIPADTTVSCDAIPTAPTLTAVDDCGSISDVPVISRDSVVQTPNACPTKYIIFRKFIATDACGNEAVAIQQIMVQDTTSPVFNLPLPSDTTVDCHSIPPVAAVSVTDNCTPTAEIRWEMKDSTYKAPDACGENYTIYRIWRAYDACDRMAEHIQVITVKDTTGPEFIDPVPADTLIQCGDLPPFAELHAIDNCSQPNKIYVTRSQTKEPLADGCGFKYTRTWIAIDACQNKTERKQVIIVSDTTRPVILTAINDITVECSQVPDTLAIQATDNCTPTDSISVEVIDNFASDGTCGNMTITRWYIATDKCGNSDTAIQVIHLVDNTMPVFDQPAPTDIQVNCNEVPAAQTFTATDACSGQSVPVTMNETRVDLPGACPSLYQVIRTWTASDICNNVATVRQIITVIDTTGPVFINRPQEEIHASCDNIPAPVNLTATDACSGNSYDVTPSDNIVPGNCKNSYTILRTWVATDDCGNRTEIVQSIIVEDTEAPVLDVSNIAAIINTDCNNIPAPDTIPATDNCAAAQDIQVEITIENKQNGANCANGMQIIRTYTAVDECGNRSVPFVQTINVVDNTAPVWVIAPPASDTTVNCSDTLVVPVVTATDACSGDIDVVYTTNKVSTACGFIITRRWVAADACGNMITATQTVTVTDLAAPVFNTNLQDTLYADCTIPAVAAVTATDNCSPADSIQYGYSEQVDSINGACHYQIKRTWTATDPCGNVATMEQLVIIQDTTAPVIAAAPADITIGCGDAIPAAAQLVATDNCSNNFPRMAAMTEDPYTVDNCNGYTIVRRWNAVDKCGNVAVEQVQRIVVQGCGQPELDTTMPAACASNPVFTVTAKGNLQNPIYTLVSVTPAGAVTTPVSQTDNVFNLPGVTTATFTVKDGQDGCESAPVTYTLQFKQAPSVYLGNDITICSAETVTLDAGNQNSTYQIKWSTGETSQKIQVTTAGKYWVEVSNGDCVASDTIQIDLGNLQHEDIPDAVICTGYTKNLDAFTENASYVWSTGSTASNINVNTAGKYWVRIMKGSCIVVDTINVTVVPPPSLVLPPDTTICPNSSIVITAITNANTIQWSSGESTPSIVVNKPGSYTVYVSNGACVVSSTIYVQQRPTVTLNLGPDRYLCPGGRINVDARTDDASSYLWNDGNTNPIKVFTQPGTYILTILDKYCDRVIADTLNVFEGATPNVSLGNDTVICAGTSIVLKPKTAFVSNYLWSDGSTGSTLTVTQPGTYTVQVSNDCGFSQDQITITGVVCESAPEIPNVFSPNGDGKNDIFKPGTGETMYNYELRIYNRWGQMIFISHDQEQGWDGTYNGQPVEIGTYVWWLSYSKTSGGQIYVIKGDVTVIR